MTLQVHNVGSAEYILMTTINILTNVQVARLTTDSNCSISNLEPSDGRYWLQCFSPFDSPPIFPAGLTIASTPTCTPTRREPRRPR